jgi:hypothetical protein
MDGNSIASAGVISAPSLTWEPLDGNTPVRIYATLAGANPADDVDLEVLIEWTLT